jgi:phosphatidylserine decarboxylase
MIAAAGHYEPVAREAYPYACGPVIAAFAAWLLDVPLAALLFLAVGAAVLLFFRNPERRPASPSEDDLVSPADGRVVRVRDESASGSPEDGPPLRCISVFMSVFNVHVNRSPVSGAIRSVVPSPGKFLDARDHQASTLNTRNSIVIDSRGDSIRVVQVAGLIARRISCWISPRDTVSRGNRIGVVHFGSRVDLYLPYSYTPLVSVGDKLRAGETVVARRPAV